MTDLDHVNLDRLLPATPGPADWDDVLSRSGVRERRRRLVALAAVVLVVVVGTASAFAVRSLVSERGLVGLPPQGATPSMPRNGKLVASFWVAPPGTTSNPRRVRAWLYADGRLVWLRENDPHQPLPPEAANRWSSGFLEQRLTRSGVERVRSEILSTGLFGHDRNLVLDGDVDPCLNVIGVRNGGRLVELMWTSTTCKAQAPPGTLMPKTEPATPEQASALLRLKERLSDPASWLPAIAWRQPEFKPYVPSRFAVGVWSARTRKLSRISAVLPAPVQAALGDRHWRQQWSGPYFDATTEEARAIAKALAGAGPTRKGGAFHLNYQFEIPGGSGEMVVIGFEPYLPHGETTCSACG